MRNSNPSWGRPCSKASARPNRFVFPPFHDFGDIHVRLNPCRLARLQVQCQRIVSLDTNRSMDRWVSLCPASRPGSFVRMVRIAAPESLVNSGPRGAVSLKVISTTSRPLHGRSRGTGGSRRGTSSPSMRKEITSEILHSCDSSCFRGPDAIGHPTASLTGRRTHLKYPEFKSLRQKSRSR